jgi:hypothetical protein
MAPSGALLSCQILLRTDRGRYPQFWPCRPRTGHGRGAPGVVQSPGRLKRYDFCKRRNGTWDTRLATIPVRSTQLRRLSHSTGSWPRSVATRPGEGSGDRFVATLLAHGRPAVAPDNTERCGTGGGAGFRPAKRFRGLRGRLFHGVALSVLGGGMTTEPPCSAGDAPTPGRIRASRQPPPCAVEPGGVAVLR